MTQTAQAGATNAPAAGSTGRRLRMSDSERVLGQIERGEVLAGPDAARRIAARHMEAYGNAVWGPDNDTAWTDAIAGLNGGDA